MVHIEKLSLCKQKIYFYYDIFIFIIKEMTMKLYKRGMKYK